MDKRLISIKEPQEVVLNDDIKTQKNLTKSTRKKINLIISIIIYAVLIPLTIFLGVFLFKGKKYNIISIIVAFLACVPFFFTFEKSRTTAKELVIIAVMTAISVVGRLIFMAIPGFKPVTAIVIITAIAYGAKAGFLTGALSALVSNIFYGQGPWTPFQMFTWGIIGIISGLIFYKQRKPNIILLIVTGIIGGVLFSFIMDIWSVFAVDGMWNFERYLALLISSGWFIFMYALSNVIFLLLLTRPFLEKLLRIKDKYNLFS